MKEPHKSNVRYFSDAVQEQRRVKCFMDGIDWEHHLDGDSNGTLLFPSVEAAKDVRTCIVKGGCGVVEVEVRLVRWVEPQALTYIEVPKDG